MAETKASSSAPPHAPKTPSLDAVIFRDHGALASYLRTNDGRLEWAHDDVEWAHLLALVRSSTSGKMHHDSTAARPTTARRHSWPLLEEQAHSVDGSLRQSASTSGMASRFDVASVAVAMRSMWRPTRLELERSRAPLAEEIGFVGGWAG